ncbi:MAG: hypothetical protein ACI9GW_001232 [Halieaceae bacterium]|jgi:hypothetical protein
MKKVGLGLLLVIVVLVILLVINPTIRPSHVEPYQKLVAEQTSPAPTESEILQRVVLFGDAGHSSLEPWQASMTRVAARAGISPDKTVVVALGDNIYMSGYPQKESGQESWDEGQLESISYLDAQLKVAEESGATMFLVPGNHDWYASEVDSQAAHIAAFARERAVATRFEPYEQGQPPLPESEDFPGVSLVFLDSEWLLRADDSQRDAAMAELDAQLARIRTAQADSLIVLTAHHPLETMGPHGGYLADFGYWLVMKILYAFTDAEDEDTNSSRYQLYIAAINEVVTKYDKVIFAAGHEHSLQVFRSSNDQGPEYTLVSGAANTSKVSGVWHTDDTRFALAQEGFLELAVTAQGVYLQVFDINHDQAVGAYWLAF